MEVDWADGDYERMAVALEPAAATLAAYAGVAPGQHVIDVGCGSGNATAAAAALGARVTGVDPAEGLIEIARDRVAMLDADVSFHHGAAEDLPVADAVADVTVSAFAVIFAEDPTSSLAEMVRATRPGGTIALTSWRSEGVICSIGEALRRRLPPAEILDHQRWGDDDWVRQLLTEAGLTEIEVAGGTVEFRADSAEDFLEELEQHHPAWRAALRELGDGDRSAAHDEALEILHDGNEEPNAFLATSAYALIRARVPEGEVTDA